MHIHSMRGAIGRSKPTWLNDAALRPILNVSVPSAESKGGVSLRVELSKPHNLGNIDKFHLDGVWGWQEDRSYSAG